MLALKKKNKRVEEEKKIAEAEGKEYKKKKPAAELRL